MAEMELSVLNRQWLNRRFDSAGCIDLEMQAWSRSRNDSYCGASWRFTTANAGIKLKRLYPIPDDF